MIYYSIIFFIIIIKNYLFSNRVFLFIIVTIEWLPKSFACFPDGTFVNFKNVASFDACRKICVDFLEQGGLNFCLSFSYNPKAKLCKPSQFNSKYVAYYKKPCNTDPNDWEYSEWTPKSSKPGI